MPFASGIFAAFLLCTLSLYYILSLKYQNILLLIASYVFYGWLDIRFCILLLAATLISYLSSLGMTRYKEKKSASRWVLVAGIVCLLGILATFKYLDFFISSAAGLLSSFGFETHLPTLGILLPVGVSFYTFCLVGYLADVFRGTIKPSSNPVTFALFASFFPQILAGPIARAQHLLPQFSKTRRVNSQHISEGVELIFTGLVRKVEISDILLKPVNDIYANVDAMQAGPLLAGFYLYGLLIYCDFAGYSEMARGVARLFGIDVAQNFLQPYFSRSFGEFWKRWHISLGNWLRDYLYIPLGGNRRGLGRTVLNIFITMLLCGLWHEAGLTFIAWGAFHGLMLIAERLGKAFFKRQASDTLAPVKIAIVFHLVLFAWVLFRAESFDQAFTYLGRMFTSDLGPWTFHWTLLAYATILTLLIDLPQAITRNIFVLGRMNIHIRAVLVTVMLGLLVITWSTEYVPFIYSQF